MVITGQQVFDIDFLRYILADKCRLLAELPLPVFSPCSALSPVCAEERFLSAVERWIGKINVVFLRHAVLCQPKAFAEALEVDHLPLAQELDDVVHVRVVTEAEDVVVGHPGLLLCRQILRQVSDQIALAGHTGGAVGEPGRGGGIYACRTVNEVGVKSRGLDLLICKIAGQLVDDGANHFQMPQLFRPYKGGEMYQFRTGRIQWFQRLASRLPLHPAASAGTLSPPENRGDELL